MDLIQILAAVGDRKPELMEFASRAVAAITKAADMRIELSNSPTPGSEDAVAYAYRGKRFITTLGRLLTRQLGFDPQGDSLNIQSLSDAFRAIVRSANCTFDILTGKDISQAYRDALGGTSCMTGSTRSGYVSLYEQNPETIAMLKFGSPSGTQARAMLWTDIEGKRFLDRIYPNDGWHIQVIEDYARMNGWFVRTHHGAPNSSENARRSDGLAPVLVSNTKALGESGVGRHRKMWPYLDTMAYGIRLADGRYALWCEMESSKTDRYKFKHTFYLQSTAGLARDSRRCSKCFEIGTDITYIAPLVFSAKMGGMEYCQRVSVCSACYKEMLGSGELVKCATCGNLLLKGLFKKPGRPSCSSHTDGLVDTDPSNFGAASENTYEKLFGKFPQLNKGE